MKKTKMRNGGAHNQLKSAAGASLLVDSRRYIDLSEWHMSRELRQRVDVRDFPEELGTNDRPRE